MNYPTLSILIPALAERKAYLMAELNRQIGDKPVELLVLTDNRKRSTGMKRQALLHLARGLYLTHLDDDDGVAPNYVEEILKALTFSPDQPLPDVVVFNQLCTWNGEGPFTVRCGIEYENEGMHKNEAGIWQDIRRKPWHWNVWLSALAQTASFPDGYIDDDWFWVKQLVPKVKNQARIDKVLHYYRYSSTTSASQQGTPTT